MEAQKTKDKNHARNIFRRVESSSTQALNQICLYEQLVSTNRSALYVFKVRGSPGWRKRQRWRPL